MTKKQLDTNKKEIRITVTKEEYEEIKAYAEGCERTPSNFLKYAVKTTMKRYPIVGVNK